MQDLIFATIEDPLTRQITENIGIVQPLESPFNLFLNLNQLTDPYQETVDFFIYSIGAQKIILWGQYNKTTEEFRIDDSCRYKGPQLYEITMHWIKNGYTYVGNTVRNRPQEIISKELAGERMSSDEYIRKRYLLAYLQGEVSEEDYLRRFGQLPLLPEDDYLLLDYMADLESELKEYEKATLTPVTVTEGPFQQFGRGQMMTYSEYVQKKLLLAYLLGRIPKTIYLSRYEFLPLTEIDVEALQDQLGRYERMINRTDLNYNVSRDLVEDITNKFAYQVARQTYSNLNFCPTLQECRSSFNEGCGVYYNTRYDLR